MNYEQLKAETTRGWNTWNTINMLSYLHLPHGFAINLCLKDFSSDKVLREFSICESTGDGALLRPEPRTYDGSYIEINVSYRSTEINIRSTVVGEFSDRISPTSFYAFLASGVTDEQKWDMIHTWFSPADKFGGEFIMPAISRDDLAYAKQQMEKFSGRVGPPVNYG